MALRRLNKYMKNKLINLIKRYQKELSPKLEARGVKCIFERSCSKHAVDVLERHNVLVALVLITYRLLSCNPINARFKSKNLIHQPHGTRI